MSSKELIKYFLKTLIDFKLKRSVYSWGIKYLTISLVTELFQMSAGSKMDLFYNYIENEYGLIVYFLFWIFLEIILGGFTIVYSWLSISIKIGLIVLWSILEYQIKSSASLINFNAGKKLKVNTKWFDKIKKYEDSIDFKTKYAEKRYHSTEFEENYIDPIIDVTKSKKEIIDNISDLGDSFQSYKTAYNQLLSLLKNSDLKLPVNEKFQESSKNLKRFLEENRNHFLKSIKLLNKKRYKFLSQLKDLEFELPEVAMDLNFIRPFSAEFKNWRPEDKKIYNNFEYQYNNLIRSLLDVQNKIQKLNENTLFVNGDAGTGKTNLSINISKKIKENGDFCILLTGKWFSDSSTNFDQVFKKLIGAPEHETLDGVLLKLSGFGKKKNRRIFIIIDGLNETTDSNIGFNKMWSLHLDRFTRIIESYSHLYLICTLRTSYIDRIWNSRIPQLYEINGWTNFRNRREACGKYFKYYKIEVENFEESNLGFFRVPLLLDLFCKLTNGERKRVKQIALSIESYKIVFMDYVQSLKEEVRIKKGLASIAPINEGFINNSKRLLNSVDGSCGIEDFITDFDDNPRIREDESLAKAILEGYLIYIKDIRKTDSTEIVRHTQQEVGGYLLADYIHKEYENLYDLIESDLFKDKLIGTDYEKTHQLRFDILKFLISMRPDIAFQTDSIEILKLAWWYLYSTKAENIDEQYIQKLISRSDNHVVLRDIINYSISSWKVIDYKFNFRFIFNLLKSLPEFFYDLEWGGYLYKNLYFFEEFIDDYSKNLKKIEEDELELKTIFLISILSTTARDIRDSGSLALLEYAELFPLNFLEKTEEVIDFDDIYIYERMSQICFGVCLRMQNNKDWVDNYLAIYADKVYELQFHEGSRNTTFNYIVIDSFKHIIDLAVFKGVYEDPLPRNLDNPFVSFQFRPPFEWPELNERIEDIVIRGGETGQPDPIQMDFSVYTIPRLIDRDEISVTEARGHIYQRIINLGYKDLANQQQLSNNNEFLWGSRIYQHDGKIDRLGKKYCWKAFFDYAGQLIIEEKLDVFSENDTHSTGSYNRLSDVDIDISSPRLNYLINERFYQENLLSNLSNKNWPEENKIDSVLPLLTKVFEEDNYQMLYGIIDQRKDESYDIRSLLLIESMFVSKNELQKFKDLEGFNLEWDRGRYNTSGNIGAAYFGELYWADSVPTAIPNYETFPLIEEGRIVGEFASLAEPSLMEFRWESNSNIFKTFVELIPSSNLGKKLNLKSDPLNGKILDENLKESFKVIEFENSNFFKNNFNYFRKDLLKQYLDDNDLLLLYQVKQHSYDQSSSHNRALKFFLMNK